MPPPPATPTLLTVGPTLLLELAVPQGLALAPPLAVGAGGVGVAPLDTLTVPDTVGVEEREGVSVGLPELQPLPVTVGDAEGVKESLAVGVALVVEETEGLQETLEVRVERRGVGHGEALRVPDTHEVLVGVVDGDPLPLRVFVLIVGLAV